MTYWDLLVLSVVCTVLTIALAAFFAAARGDVSKMLVMCAGIILGVASLGFGTVFLGGNIIRASCLEQGELTGMNVQYELLSGCYVHVDDRLIPYDRWVQVSGVNTP